MSGPARITGQIEGRCLCGQVTIRVDGAHRPEVGVCHCLMCQRWNGVLFGAFDASADAVTITGEVARYKSTRFAERAFCPRCGSHLWLQDTYEDGLDYELMPGLFAGAAGFPLISEIYTDRAPAYVPLAGGHRRATRAEYETDNRFVEGDLT